MATQKEFFVPLNVTDLENAEQSDMDRYCIELMCEFNVPISQQLDDLTHLFDALHHEKSAAALFSKQEYFAPLYSYVKTLSNPQTSSCVSRKARHKLCHEIGAVMKRILEAIPHFHHKNAQETTERNQSVGLYLRSALKMCAFILAHVLLSTAPLTEEDESSVLSQRSVSRKRRRGVPADSGFADDSSGVDQDGRELALAGFVELLSPEVCQLWGEKGLEGHLLHLIFRMTLHMITQKANVNKDAHAISGGLTTVMAKVAKGLAVSSDSAHGYASIISPIVELLIKSEYTAVFLSSFVGEIESDETDPSKPSGLVSVLFESVTEAAIYEAPGNSAAAKNIAIFLTEVAKKSISVLLKMNDKIMPIIQSESYEIRKATITCISEVILQCYSAPSISAGDEVSRHLYLRELLHRILDYNAFVRNHVVHLWEHLTESKMVPRQYYLPLTESLVGRLEDRNYLVRDSAMAAIGTVLKHEWFGNVLSYELVAEKLRDAKADLASSIDASELETVLEVARSMNRPPPEDRELDAEANEEPVDNGANLSAEVKQLAKRVVFYESASKFIEHMKTAMRHVSSLLDSKTERDVIEAIRLVVVFCECRMDGSDALFLKTLSMVFEGELKIQCAVRDAFAEVIFNFYTRSTSSVVTRCSASVHKLISVMRSASEGDISAIERILSLLKSTPTYTRYLSLTFIESVWSVVEGSTASTTLSDRRLAMQLYSLITQHQWRDLKSRSESIIQLVNSPSGRDNIILSYALKALQNAALDPEYVPIHSRTNPLEHSVLRLIVLALCRQSTNLFSWMRVAEQGINAVHVLCEVPAVMYTYLITCMAKRVEEESSSQRRSQLYFLVGHTALKQLVAVENAEKKEIRKMDEETNANAKNATADSMYKELGLGSHEFRRHALQELTIKRRQAILAEGSLWWNFCDPIVQVCREKCGVSQQSEIERICAVLSLCKLMIVSEAFCKEHLDTLFSIVKNKNEHWAVKTNIVIALGDLACVHPNLLAPYLKVPTTGFFKLLDDDDLRVRAVTIQVCSHLILGEMLRIREHLYTIVKLVADCDPTIASNALMFVQNLAVKEKDKTGNLIPPLVSKLSRCIPSDKFQLAMRPLLERVAGDKPTESLIDNLCRKFESFSERDSKKLSMARNLAFCLSELDYSTENSIKKISSEICYQMYKQWLRDDQVFDYLKSIAQKSKRSTRIGTERRDKGAIEEWEARMMVDRGTTPVAETKAKASSESDDEENANPQHENSSRSSGAQSAAGTSSARVSGTEKALLENDAIANAS